MVLEYVAEKVNYYMPDWRRRLQDAKAHIGQWGRDVRLSLAKLVVLFVVTLVAYAVVLLYLRSFWSTFQYTNVGRVFLDGHASESIVRFFGMIEGDLFTLSWRVCADVLFVALLVGVVAQFSALRRYCYYGRGVVGHLAWTLGIVLCAFYDVFGILSLGSQTSPALFFIPSLCLHDRCLKLTAYLVPEFSIVFGLRRLKTFFKVARIRNLSQ